MRAVVFDEPGRVAVRDVPDAVIEDPGDALIRVTVAGICGSDLHLVHGKAPMEPGEALGHEAVGVVEQVGSDVTRSSPGDRVVVSFVIACGSCWFCTHQQSGLCEDFRNLGAGIFGGALGGAQAELLRVPSADWNLLAVPDGVDDEHAVFAGDVLSTALYGAALGGIEAGDTVAVIGGGPVGFLSAQAARAFSPGEVLLLERDRARLDLAGHAGLTGIDVGASNAVMAVADRTDGRGADVVLEAVGSAEAFTSAVDLVRRGGTVAVIGLYSTEVVQTQLGVDWARALTLRFAGITPVHAWWEQALEAMATGRVDPAPLISHRLSLDDAPEAYELFAARRATKVLLRP